MTLFSPTISVERLIVQASGKTVLDALFHSGINVLYGENASGKTTILEFIFYCLGGEGPRWKAAAEKCDRAILEVRLNGEPVVLARAIESARGRPLSIYWGEMDEASVNSMKGWEVYPYSRSANKESFSQVLFSALDMPEVPVDEASNLTMHQLLRLVYEDQMSSPEDIFRTDQFDRDLTKETVGELVCGVYDPELYAEQLRIRANEKELDVVQGEIRSLFSALGSIAEDFSLEKVVAELANAENEREGLYARVGDVEKGRVDDSAEAGDTDLKELYDLITSHGQDLVESEQAVSALAFEEAESAHFIEALEGNLGALNQSEAAHLELGAIPFSYCPACLAPIDRHDSEGYCYLCKEPYHPDGRKPHQLRLKRELEMQIRESRQIQKERNIERIEREVRLKDLRRSRKVLIAEYQAKMKSPASDVEKRLRKYYERIGWLDRQVEVLHQRISIAEKINELSDRKAQLSSEKSRLDDSIRSRKSRQEERRSKAYTMLSEKTREFLNRDLAREDSFSNAEHVDFSFSKERISVDGESRFAASSSVYLKNSFMAGILFSSLEDSDFGFPRFLMLDGIEDKGMEEERIHRFQELLLKYSLNQETDHQIILTAQTLSNKLLDDRFLVLGRLTHDNKSLSL